MDFRNFMGIQDLVDVEEELDGVADLAHTDDEVGADSSPEFGWVFDLVGGDFQNFRDVVDDDAGGHLALLVPDFNDDNARLVGMVGGIHGELGAEVDNGDNLPAEIDDPLDIGRGLGDRGDFHAADDLADLEDFEAEIYFTESKVRNLPP